MMGDTSHENKTNINGTYYGFVVVVLLSSREKIVPVAVNTWVVMTQETPSL